MTVEDRGDHVGNERGLAGLLRRAVDLGDAAGRDERLNHPLRLCRSLLRKLPGRDEPHLMLAVRAIIGTCYSGVQLPRSRLRHETI